MKQIVSDSSLVAKCGLYCGACHSFVKGKCPGCTENAKATWCKVRKCCLENGYHSCADCKSFTNPLVCKLYNNVASRVFGFIFKSDRNACLNLIKSRGYEDFANFMATRGWHSIKRQ